MDEGYIYAKLNSMDEESKNKLRNEKYMEYMRKNKAQ